MSVCYSEISNLINDGSENNKKIECILGKIELGAYDDSSEINRPSQIEMETFASSFDKIS